MNIIYAEYNIHHNSIDIYPYASYICSVLIVGKPKKIWKPPRITMCVKCTFHWQSAGICMIVSWWYDAGMGGYGGFSWIVISNLLDIEFHSNYLYKPSKSITNPDNKNKGNKIKEHQNKRQLPQGFTMKMSITGRLDNKNDTILTIVPLGVFKGVFIWTPL